MNDNNSTGAAFHQALYEHGPSVMQCEWGALIWLDEEEHKVIMEHTGKVSTVTVHNIILPWCSSYYLMDCGKCPKTHSEVQLKCAVV